MGPSASERPQQHARLQPAEDVPPAGLQVHQDDQRRIARDAGTRAAAVWVFAGISLVIAYAVLPGGQITRVAVAFAVASLVLVAGLAWLVRRGAAE